MAFADPGRRGGAHRLLTSPECHCRSLLGCSTARSPGTRRTSAPLPLRCTGSCCCCCGSRTRTPGPLRRRRCNIPWKPKVRKQIVKSTVYLCVSCAHMRATAPSVPVTKVDIKAATRAQAERRSGNGFFSSKCPWLMCTWSLLVKYEKRMGF